MKPICNCSPIPTGLATLFFALFAGELFAQPTMPRTLLTDFSNQSDSVVSDGAFDDPAMVDYWTFTATPGQRLVLAIEREEDHFDPLVWVFNGNIVDQSFFAGGATEFIDSLDPGFLAIQDDGVGPLGFYGTQDPRVSIDLEGPSTTYTVIVASFLSGMEIGGNYDFADGGDGHYNYTIRAAVFTPAAPTVVGRHIFYNNSVFDGNEPSPNVADDNSIAPNKVAYVAGSGRTTFENYTNYSRGINGIMVDIQNLPGTPTADDFEFRVGNSNTPTTWLAPPAFAVSAVTVRRGAGVFGSDRITIVFADEAVRKQWLQVRVLPTDQTGLATSDVHYWGNAVAEVDSPNATQTVAIVDITDVSAIRNNPRSGLNPAPIDFKFDINRDARVDIADISLARNNPASSLTGLRLINLP